MSKKVMSKPLRSIGYYADNTVDKDIIKEANIYASREENDGITSLASLRNFFLRKLREDNERYAQEQAKAS